jgi:hypothetical protein
MESAEEEAERVKGGAEVAKQAAAGLALFAAEEGGKAEVDKDAAQKFKDETDAKIKALEAEAEALTGKDNKKARSEKSKEASALSKTPEYIDATRVLKDQEPKNGNFIKKAAAPSAAAAAAAAAAPADEPAAADEKKSGKDKPKKAAQAAGISPAERKELESLKDDIIKKKKELKEGGMSGGQINKEESIVAMVARMNELKEKENPGCLEAAKSEKKESGKKGKKLSAEQEAGLAALEQEIEEYRQRLAGPEFKYSKKEINADPDMQDMMKKLNDLKK